MFLLYRSASSGPARTFSAARAMRAHWPTVRSRWSATCAAPVPLEPLAAKCMSPRGRTLTTAAGPCNQSYFFRGDAALSNFHRAWSPAKKQWCCQERQKGCEGNTKPSVDPGAGMMWKHVQINGYWVWQVVAGGGGAVAVPPSLPYDCSVGQVNWKIGWSAPKKTWCCAHNHVGCPGDAGGVASHATHVTVHYSHGGVVAGGAAGGAAGAAAAGAAGGGFSAGGSWHHEMHTGTVHVVHHVVHHIAHARRLAEGGGRPRRPREACAGFDCDAGRASLASWSQARKSRGTRHRPVDL